MKDIIDPNRVPTSNTEYSLDNVRRRFLTPGGWRDALEDTYIEPGKAYLERTATPGYMAPDRIRNFTKGLEVPFNERLPKNIGTITKGGKEVARTIPGTRFAGTNLALGLKNSNALRTAINFIPGLNLVGDVFDVGEAVVSVLRGDRERQNQAKQLARELASSGMNLDQAIDYVESNAQLQDLAGNIGIDDFGKTLAYGAFTGGPSLNPIAAAAGLITGTDLQREKAIRNRMFKEEFQRASQGILGV
jgi:hypothetical protein